MSDPLLLQVDETAKRVNMLARLVEEIIAEERERRERNLLSAVKSLEAERTRCKTLEGKLSALVDAPKGHVTG